MNVSAPFIRRKVMTTLLMVFITGVGLLGYQALSVSDLPVVDFPTISVTARLPGANPDTMASAVATPLDGAGTSKHGGRYSPPGARVVNFASEAGLAVTGGPGIPAGRSRRCAR